MPVTRLVKTPPQKISPMPAPEPARKVLGFYLDSEGQIQVLEEGLTAVERLALLNFGQNFCQLQSRAFVFSSGEKTRLSETG